MGRIRIRVQESVQRNGIAAYSPVVAKGIIAIGQFGVGFINISQIGIGIISVSQFTIGFYALAQIAFAYSLIAQIGVYIESGYGQVVWKLADLLAKF
jgi:hypothetical protein